MNVADPEAGLVGDLLLDRHQRRAVVVRWPPLALEQFVAAAEFLRPGEILLAVHEPLRVLGRVLAVLDGLAVDRGHAGPHQGREVRGFHAARFENGLDRPRLTALDVDQEVVRCILVERLPPAFEQVGAYQRQQQQHREAQAEGHDLHGAGAPAARDVGEAVAPCDSDTGTKPAHGRDEAAAHEIQRGRDRDDPAEHNHQHGRVADGPVQERGHRGQ